jgi:hypothetical protein
VLLAASQIVLVRDDYYSLGTLAGPLVGRSQVHRKALLAILIPLLSMVTSPERLARGNTHLFYTPHRLELTLQTPGWIQKNMEYIIHFPAFNQ